ncbi:acyltransferase family protein [uncultured Fibrella sp.]|uniref:acyltransferase family protein n=1 Tax=uncultured Fibrella sp. TaxID=1284596 RepID=UPI0035C9FE33
MQPASAPSPSSPLTLPIANRRYDLDWLRIIAIIILLFYHTGMIYVSWGWHIKSPQHSQPMEEVMRWLHRWRMPLLFFISGAGTFFALRKRSYGAYAGERVRRLFIPLVFGMFVVVPPQIYIEWLFRGRFAGSYLDFYPEVFHFQSYKDGGTGGAFSWHHLWFICYLFFYSLLSIPIFRWLKSPGGQRFTDRLGTLLARPGGALWLVGALLINDVALGGLFPRETHGLTDDWAYFVKNLLLFWAGYLLISRQLFWQILADQRRYFLVATLICTALLYGSRAIFDEETIDQNTLSRTLYSFNSLCLTWFSVLATVGYGYTYLNKNHRWLPHLNAAVYPFYILHQTVIVLIGYYVLTKTPFGVYSGFLVVSFASLAVCIVTYLLLIRPFWLTRLFFGVKM